MNYKLDLTAAGSREEISQALRLLANQIADEFISHDEIDGADFNDCCLTVDEFIPVSELN